MDYSSLKPCELIRVCVETGDPAAWTEFFHRFHRTIAGVALRTARRCESNPLLSTIDDLIQDIFVKFLTGKSESLRDFQEHRENGTFGFIKKVTVHCVIDYYRRKNTDSRGGGIPEENIDNVHCASDVRHYGSAARIERERELQEIDAAVLKCAKGPTADRDIKIFYFYFRHGYTALEISHLPGINMTVKGVESALFRLVRLVNAEMAPKRAAKKKEGFPGNEPLLGGESQ